MGTCNLAIGQCQTADGLSFMQGIPPIPPAKTEEAKEELTAEVGSYTDHAGYTCADGLTCCFGDDGHIHSPFCCGPQTTCNLELGQCQTADGLSFMQGIPPIPPAKAEEAKEELKAEVGSCTDHAGYTCADGLTCCFGDDGHIHSPFCCGPQTTCNLAMGQCQTADGLSFMQGTPPIPPVKAEPETAQVALKAEVGSCTDHAGYTCAD